MYLKKQPRKTIFFFGKNNHLVQNRHFILKRYFFFFYEKNTFRIVLEFLTEISKFRRRKRKKDLEF